MTVTRTSSPSASSITVPKMMLASWCATPCTTSAASFTSISPRLEEPEMLSSMPWDRSIEDSSSGLEIAPRAAATARPSPVADPTPISALPASVSTVRTSAKSTLISPGVVMRLVMPPTPCISTSSAMRKALSMEVFSSAMAMSRSLGMTIRVSTFSLSRWIPSSA